MVTSVSQFREATLQAFKELKVNELCLQLGVQDDPSTYSKSIQVDIRAAYLALAIEQPEILNERLVRVVDPRGQLVMNGVRGVAREN